MSVEEIKGIFEFLSTRMSKDEKINLLNRLGASSVKEVIESGNENALEALRLEKRKRMKVSDARFQLSDAPIGPVSAADPRGSRGIRAYKSHVDKCIGDND